MATLGIKEFLRSETGQEDSEGGAGVLELLHFIFIIKSGRTSS